MTDFSLSVFIFAMGSTLLVVSFGVALLIWHIHMDIMEGRKKK